MIGSSVRRFLAKVLPEKSIRGLHSSLIPHDEYGRSQVNILVSHQKIKSSTFAPLAGKNQKNSYEYDEMNIVIYQER